MTLVTANANHTRAAHAAMDFNPQGFQGSGHFLRRAEFRHAEFRMGMQITPEGSEFGLVAADGFNWGHGGAPGAGFPPILPGSGAGRKNRA